jgi:hypothetical protein
VSLDQDASFFLISLAQSFPSFYSFRESGTKILGLSDAHTVRTFPAKIRKSVRGGWFKAVHRPRQHESQGVLAGAGGSSKDDGLRQALARQHLAQAAHRFRIALKIREAHGLDSKKRLAVSL